MIRGSVWAFAVVVTLALFASLAACQGPSDDQTLGPSPTSSRIVRFDTNDQALTAARNLYEKYLDASDKVSADGGVGVERLASYVTTDELKVRSEGADYLKQNKLKIVGTTKLRTFGLQRADLATGEVQAYACLDFRKARVIDAAGDDVTPKTRQDKQTALASFVWRDGGLRLNESGQWSGESVC